MGQIGHAPSPQSAFGIDDVPVTELLEVAILCAEHGHLIMLKVLKARLLIELDVAMPMLQAAKLKAAGK